MLATTTIDRLRLLACSAVLCFAFVSPVPAQVEVVSGNFDLWSSGTETWYPSSFENYYAGSSFPYPGTGCISASGPVTLVVAAGATMTLELSNGACPVYDGTSVDNIGADAQIPPSETLTLSFDPPIHGFFALYASVAVGKAVSLRAVGVGIDQTFVAPPSTDSTAGSGFGFVSEQAVATIEISSDENGIALLGHFLGVVPGDQVITGPNGLACTNGPCDYAIAYEVHRPRIFLTPSAGPGDLSTWDEVDTGVGAAAGDEICQFWAGELGYPGHQRFVAALRVGSTHPFCRAVGLAGPYVSGACGGVLFPAREARWWRVDGVPFGPFSPGATSIVPGTLRPLLDANGNRVDGSHATGWTETRSCGDWTSSSGTVSLGLPNAINEKWMTDNTLGSCAADHRLLCVERALGLPFPPGSAPGRSAFVTRADGPGNLLSWPEADPMATTGFEAADSICESEASAAGLDQPASFRAWLSTPGQDAVSRMTEPGPIARTDGVGLASSIADLVDGHIGTGIILDAEGFRVPNGIVWTGTAADGTYSGLGCGDWDSTAGSASVGLTTFADGWWTDGSLWPCSGDVHLYCISNVAFTDIFEDGFETGDSGRWSAAVP